jgi:hypothetical protein
VKEAGTSGTVGLGLTGLYYDGWLEVGLAYTAETALFSYNAQIPGALIGIRAEPAPWIRFDLLAEGGGYFVSSVGNGLFVTSVTGGQAALPYVGGKASASALVGSGHRLLLGFWASAGDTVGETMMSPVVSSCFLGCSSTQENFTFGGASWSVGIRAGADITRW